MLDQAKGGVATAWMLHEMKARGIVPLALVFNRVNPILAQGAAFGGVTMVDRFADGDVTDLIRTGDTLRIDPAAGSSRSCSRLSRLALMIDRNYAGPGISTMTEPVSRHGHAERVEHDAMPRRADPALSGNAVDSLRMPPPVSISSATWMTSYPASKQPELHPGNQ